MVVVYAALPFLAVCLSVVIRLAHRGTGHAPPLAVALGVVFILGGAGLDIGATLIHTPDLANEGNLFVQLLFQSGHSRTFVIVFATIGQTLYVTTLCTLWVGLLRHRSTLIESVKGVRSPFRFLKAATGGADLRWRQWLLPLRMADLPWAYHVVWLLAVVLLAGATDRWFLGLEWFQLVPPDPRPCESGCHRQRIGWLLRLAVGGRRRERGETRGMKVGDKTERYRRGKPGGSLGLRRLAGFAAARWVCGGSLDGAGGVDALGNDFLFDVPRRIVMSSRRPVLNRQSRHRLKSPSLVTSSPNQSSPATGQHVPTRSPRRRTSSTFWATPSRRLMRSPMIPVSSK